MSQKKPDLEDSTQLGELETGVPCMGRFKSLGVDDSEVITEARLQRSGSCYAPCEVILTLVPMLSAGCIGRQPLQQAKQPMCGLKLTYQDD